MDRMVPPVRPGDRIRLVEMPEDPNPIQPGEMGTVRSLADIGFEGRPETHITVDWDSGRTLSLIYPPDRFEVIAAPSLPF